MYIRHRRIFPFPVRSDGKWKWLQKRHDRDKHIAHRLLSTNCLTYHTGTVKHRTWRTAGVLSSHLCIFMTMRVWSRRLDLPSAVRYPDSKVHGANMGPIWGRQDLGPIWGRQDPGGPHVGPMKLVIWVYRYNMVNNLQNFWGAPSPTVKHWTAESGRGLAPCKPVSGADVTHSFIVSGRHRVQSHLEKRGIKLSINTKNKHPNGQDMGCVLSVQSLKIVGIPAGHMIPKCTAVYTEYTVCEVPLTSI